MKAEIWLSLSVMLPAIAGVVTFLLPAAQRRMAGVVAGILTAVTAGGAAYQVSKGEPLRLSLGGWGAPLGIDLYADGLTALMLLFAAVIGLAVTVYAYGYFKDSSNRAVHLFWPLWLLQWSGMHALLLSSDLFNLYVTLEVISLASVSMVAMAGSAAALRAALRYLFLALLGSLSYLLGVGLLYSATGVLDLYQTAAQFNPEQGVSVAAVTLMVVGLLVKCALVPLHFWLPRAHANAPAPVSALLSSLVVTSAYYLLFRLWFSVLEVKVLIGLAEALGLLGSLAILWGGWLACHQQRLKLVIAYSTVSQLGYLFLVFPLTAGEIVGEGVAWSGTVYFAVSHGLAKAAAFLAAGSLLHALGTDRLADLRGVSRHYPMTAFAFGIAAVNLMGLPPTGGFVAKWMLLKAAFLTGQWGYAVIIIAGGLLAAVYLFRVLEQFMSEPPEGAAMGHRIPMTEKGPALALAVTAVLLALVTVWPLNLITIGAPVEFTSFVPGGLP